ncbi:cytosolic Fe-S cluster assembly factor nar-1 [Trichoderma asperellum]|uniref:Nuclear architecture-related protein 1 n=1 Tax=Trichoderma asperellum TaxID=101201 RepID=A0A6V8QMY7_TRIAP|nr:cytosolic Fe-S cluster assembly factor nar-1 [Trichoderma asperellum]
MSAILSADDLNDFISPGVACIKPVETLPAVPAQPSANEYEVVLDGQHHSTANAASPAQISLTDCLACSGCVTSAEAILVSLQSHSEVISTLDAAPALRVVGPDAQGNFKVEGLENEDAKLFVASVSSQTRANLAAACGRDVSESQAGYMLENLLRSPEGLAKGGKWHNSFEWVVDINVARDATLALGAAEVLSSPTPGVSTPSTPILSSSCPGWVCYAEKTHPYVLPHLSKVKSPQALMGTILKTTLSRKLGIPPSSIWHVAVMPCFDKKLEASREELTDEVWARSGLPGRGVRDVDCVITSSEIQINRGRNVDVVEYSITVNGEPVFKAARYYGFRNIQNLVRRLKPARPSRMPGGKPFGSARRPAGKAASLDFSFVEVMACPGGCTNGGGQIKVDDAIILERKNISGKPGPQEQKDWLAEIDEAYFSGEDSQSRLDGGSPENMNGSVSHTYIDDTLAYWSSMTGIGLDRLAFTSYREVISDVGKGSATESAAHLAGKAGGGW